MAIRKSIISFLSLIFVLSVTVENSYAFFDSMFSRKNETIKIGSWTSIDTPLTKANLIQYLSTYNTIITTKSNNQISDIRTYLNSILFEQNGDVNQVFKSYTLNQMKEMIDLIKVNTQSFLVLDSNNQALFPNENTVAPITLNIRQPLLPGESININQALLTANLSSISYYSPLMLSITIEGQNGENLSDFAVETLFDKNAYDSKSSFSYNYLLRDLNSWNNNRSIGGNNASSNKLSAISSNLNYSTKVYKLINSSYILKDYRHLIKVPAVGSYSRIDGPNYLLDRPSNSPIGEHQQFIEATPKTRDGLILMGKTDGLKAELRIDIPIRKPANGISAPILPIIFSVSRGLELNSNGTVTAYQATNPITPIVKIKVIQGTTWS